MGNVWAQFEKLLPKKKQFIGKVTSINTTEKTSIIAIIGGGSFVAKGSDLEVGAYCIIKDGAIEREVAELPIYTVTIY